MRSSLQDLLEYTTLDREAQIVEVDLNKVIENVVENQEMLIAEKRAVIQSETLPVLKAVPVQMQQLLGNIINNALKYSKKGVPPIITIAAKPFDSTASAAENLQLNKEKQYVEIVVTDNGIGFPAEYAKKLFMLFQRLHSRQHYSGTGIGLAICKKIVLRHGGDIYAAGKEGEGARFHIVLPRE